MGLLEGQYGTSSSAVFVRRPRHLAALLPVRDVRVSFTAYILACVRDIRATHSQFIRRPVNAIFAMINDSLVEDIRDRREKWLTYPANRNNCGHNCGSTSSLVFDQ